MNIRCRVGVTVVIAALLLATALAARPRQGCRRAPNYDLAAETTIGGIVGGLEEVETPSGQIGIHIILEIDEAIYEVCVGPASFLEGEEFALAIDDEIKITGVWWTENEETPARLIAREITLGDRTLVLRDDQGRPRWAGWRLRSDARF